jgi:hypothetical protein
VKTKILKLELKPDANGEVLTAENVEQMRQKMYTSIDDNVPEKARDGARKQADELVAELLSGGVRALGARSCIAAINVAIDAIDGLPRSVQTIAQTLDTPSHIFDLGGAYHQIIAAHGLLELTKKSLEDYLECDHCTPKTEPEEPKGPLS